MVVNDMWSKLPRFTEGPSDGAKSSIPGPGAYEIKERWNSSHSAHIDGNIQRFSEAIPESATVTPLTTSASNIHSTNPRVRSKSDKISADVTLTKHELADMQKLCRKLKLNADRDEREKILREKDLQGVKEALQRSESKRHALIIEKQNLETSLIAEEKTNKELSRQNSLLRLHGSKADEKLTKQFDNAVEESTTAQRLLIETTKEKDEMSKLLEYSEVRFKEVLTRAEDAEKQVDMTNEDLAVVTDENTLLKTNLVDIEVQLKELQTRAEDAEKQVDMTNEDLAVVTDENTLLKTNLVDIEVQLKELQTRAEDAEKQVDMTNEDLAVVTDENTLLKTNLVDIEVQLKELQTRAEDAEKQVDVTNEEYNEVLSSRNETELHCEQLLSSLKKVQDQLIEKSSRVESKESELESLKTNMMNLTNSLETTTSQLMLRNHELSETQKQLGVSQQDVEHWIGRTKEISHWHEQSEQRAEKNEKNNLLLQLDLEDAETRLLHSSEQSKSLAASILELSQTNVVVEELNRLCESDIASLRSKLANVKQEAGRVTEWYHEAVEDAHRNKNLMITALNDVETTRRSAKESKMKLKIAHRKLDEKCKRLLATENDCEFHLKSLENMNEELTSLREESARLHEESFAQEVELRNLGRGILESHLRWKIATRALTTAECDVGKLDTVVRDLENQEGNSTDEGGSNSELAEAKTAHENAISTASSLRCAVEKIREESNRLKVAAASEQRRIEEALDILLVDTRGITRRHDELESQATALSNACSSLGKQVCTLSEEKCALEKSVEILQREKDISSDQLRVAIAESKSMASLNDTLTTRLNIADDELAAQTSRLESWECEKKELLQSMGLIIATRDNEMIKTAQLEARLSQLQETQQVKLFEVIDAKAQLAGEVDEKRVALQRAAEMELELAKVKKQKEDIESAFERLTNEHETLEERVRPFAIEMEHMEEERSHLLTKHKLCDSERDKLADLNARLLGHQNPKQKIQIVRRIKQENLDLLEDKKRMEAQISKLRTRVRVMEIEKENGSENSNNIVTSGVMRKAFKQRNNECEELRSMVRKTDEENKMIYRSIKALASMTTPSLPIHDLAPGAIIESMLEFHRLSKNRSESTI